MLENYFQDFNVQFDEVNFFFPAQFSISTKSLGKFKGIMQPRLNNTRIIDDDTDTKWWSLERSSVSTVISKSAESIFKPDFHLG